MTVGMNTAASYRRGLPGDSRRIADLMRRANSDAIFSLSDLIESGMTQDEVIDKMLLSGIGHARPGNSIIAESSGRIAGMIFIFPAERHDYSVYDLDPRWERAYDSFFNPWLGGGDSYFIHSFAVLPEFQKIGIGKELLSLSKKRAAREGYSRITVGTGEGNSASHGAYESAGFRVVGSELLVGMDILECAL
ncbi:MAG: GNAT family N-acetyltransferase [Spirochaetes bacterium]|jgi:GNAT superfamily N-acetyltransferase|nr:GNAT family N-acetyltransferase [Spirochaetota bacterium]